MSKSERHGWQRKERELENKKMTTSKRELQIWGVRQSKALEESKRGKVRKLCVFLYIVFCVTKGEKPKGDFI